ncbi:MAG: hypothetical protein IBX55_00410 [Methyloprofundus sp.]|nr:hypothetical protein [Methyloprofundus sp.]
MKSNRFYLACLRDTVGTNVTFHCTNGMGYHTDIAKAHQYTLEEAQHEWETGRDFDLPLCADKIDALSKYHVDSQLLPVETTIIDGCAAYVAFQAKRWDGNDVYWLQDNGLPTTDFSKAKVHSLIGDQQGLVWLPFSDADKVKRKVFCVNDIDRRRMITVAGLITPDHVKRAKRRKSTGKVRWNCPECGKLNWQLNPYDFEGCSDVCCSEHRA